MKMILSCFTQCVKTFPFLSPKSAKKNDEPKNIQRVVYDRPGRRYSDFHRRDSDADKRKLKISKEELLFRKHTSAAIHVQRVVRGYLGRVHRERLLIASLEEARRFWENYYAQLRWEREKRRIAELERAKLARSFVNALIGNVVNCLVRLHAAITIQRMWRGYWVRRNLVKRIPRPARIKSDLHRRFAHDTLRRVWSRRHFQPAEGWPGKSAVLHYGMWSHVHSPPKGRSYGLRTHKIRAVPKTPKEEAILRNDGNAWYGIPTAVWSSDDAKPPVSSEVLAWKKSSPFTATLVKRQTKKRKSVSYESLGWTPEQGAAGVSNEVVRESYAVEDLRTPSRGAVKPTSRSHYPAHKSGTNTQVMTSSTWGGVSQRNGLSTPLGENSSPDHGTEVEAPNLFSTNNASMSQNVSMDGTALSLPPPRTAMSGDLHTRSQPSSRARESNTHKSTTVPAHWKRESSAIPRKRTAGAQSWTPGPAPSSDAFSRDIMHRTTSAWGRLKTGSVSRLPGNDMTNPTASHAAAESRVRVWPTVARRHYTLRYTWLPQGMVDRAVNKMYDERVVDEDGLWSSSHNDASDLSAAPSLEDIEREYESKSEKYYAMEADLLSSKMSRHNLSLSAISHSSAASSIYHADFAPTGVSHSNTTLGSFSSSNRQMHPYHFL